MRWSTIPSGSCPMGFRAQKTPSLRYVIQMKGCEVFEYKQLSCRWGKCSDDLEITVAFVANLCTCIIRLAFQLQEAESIVVFVSAVYALKPADTPVGAALAAAQVSGLIVIPHLTQRCACPAYETISLISLDSFSQRRRLPASVFAGYNFTRCLWSRLRVRRWHMCSLCVYWTFFPSRRRHPGIH